MSTELQQQLARLRTENAYLGAVTGDSRRFPSIFLSPKDAAAVDTEDVYQAATVGLAELTQYDSRLELYSSTLLHPSSVLFQRELKTLEVRHLPPFIPFNG